MSAIALPTNVAGLLDEYQRKHDTIEKAISDVTASIEALRMVCCVQGTYVESLPTAPSMHEISLRKNLLMSAWRATYNRLRIGELATAKDRKLFDQAIADPPAFTVENIKATFGDYFARPRFHILRGLAEVFSALDPAYKSHSKVKIGVKGLPKRIILSGWGEYTSGWGKDRFQDMANALATFQRKPHIAWDEFRNIKPGEEAVLQERGLTVRAYSNGNAHVIFDKDTLLDINRALAEFYGDVLPDVEEDGLPQQTSTAVSKDLQFYWSPPDVVEAALAFAGVRGRDYYSGVYADKWQPSRILEPSCGDGRILDAIAAMGHKGFGIEYDAGRASQARCKGHSVLTTNFLEQPPSPEFDFVVMNPPFYGKHYAKHVRHAARFLKPGRVLVAILPATARYDHDELSDLMPQSKWADAPWKDLPVASFAEAGTNVPTTMFRYTSPLPSSERTGGEG